MKLKDLIAQFKRGGQKASFSHEDVLFILGQIDKHTQKNEPETYEYLQVNKKQKDSPIDLDRIGQSGWRLVSVVQETSTDKVFYFIR
jgi:hypothetical protein